MPSVTYLTFLLTLTTSCLHQQPISASFLFTPAIKTKKQKTHLVRHQSYYNDDQQYQQYEDLYSAIHRKEHEMKQLSKNHQSTSDPLQMAMGYMETSTPPLRLARALRRVYEDEDNPANPNRREKESDDDDDDDDDDGKNSSPSSYNTDTLSMRRGCFVADIKRKSLSAPKQQHFVHFDDAGLVAESMIQSGADCVFINVDYHNYGGDISELRSAVKRVRQTSPTAAVVAKDIVVDELQVAMAKDAGADGILLIASVLGPALENFLNLCSIIGLEAIVECHTKNEVEAALGALAQNILVSNWDRVGGVLYDDQAEKLAGLFPGSGGPIISLAGGGIKTMEQVNKILNAGYDGVVVGKAIMGNARAPEFIDAVKNRALLPAEFSGWGLGQYDIDMDGSVRVNAEGKPMKRKDFEF